MVIGQVIFCFLLNGAKLKLPLIMDFIKVAEEKMLQEKSWPPKNKKV